MLFVEGQGVEISSPNHRCDGMMGIVRNPDTHWGTVSVLVMGRTYGFLDYELIPVDSPA